MDVKTSGKVAEKKYCVQFLSKKFGSFLNLDSFR